MKKPDLKELKARFEEALKKSLSVKKFSPLLTEAISYAILGPGKRLRPLLVLAGALAQNMRTPEQAISYAMPAALALEYVHTYSLIHDDLPAMDNDDYRRGRPSLHRRFNYAMAILAGDALLADAFGLIATARLNAALLCQELSHSAGRHNLVGGQVEDLRAQKASLSLEEHLDINAKKTARLFEASAAMGAISMDANHVHQEAMRCYGHNFGVLFQLKDDLEDGDFVCDKNLDFLAALLKTHQENAYRAAMLCPDPHLLEEMLKIF